MRPAWLVLGYAHRKREVVLYLATDDELYARACMGTCHHSLGSPCWLVPIERSEESDTSPPSGGGVPEEPPTDA